MKTFRLDASSWTKTRDFYDAIFAALGSPEWHGDNVNALTESMIWGEINQVEPPYKVEVVSTAGLPPTIMRELEWASKGVILAREDFKKRMGQEVEVSFDVID